MTRRRKRPPVAVQMLLQVKCPTLPDFVHLEGISGEGVVDVAELSESQLRQLGRIWTTMLVLHATARREAAKPAKPAKPVAASPKEGE